MKQNFVIYRSSAGSGKTYALVRNYIKLALLGSEHGFKPSYFRHILAITFTNKAASEMKKRVLTFLEDLKNSKVKINCRVTHLWLYSITNFDKTLWHFRCNQKHFEIKTRRV